jgi:hypothetical protein
MSEKGTTDKVEHALITRLSSCQKNIFFGIEICTLTLCCQKRLGLQKQVLGQKAKVQVETVRLSQQSLDKEVRLMRNELDPVLQAASCRADNLLQCNTF